MGIKEGVHTAFSDNKPSPVWVRVLDDGSGNAVVTLRRNVVEVECAGDSTGDDGGGEDRGTQYQYDEANVVLVNREGLEGYALQHLDALFAYAEQKQIEESVPSHVDALTQVVTDLMREIDELKGDA